MRGVAKNSKLSIGDKVFLCNRGSLGDGKIIDIKGTWVSIKWDYELPRKPKICHAGELVKVDRAASGAIVKRVQEMRGHVRSY